MNFFVDFIEKSGISRHLIEKSYERVRLFVDFSENNRCERRGPKLKLGPGFRAKV